MRVSGLFFSLLVACSTTFAADLFVDGKPIEIEKGSLIGPELTVGGYPIFHDAGGQLRLLNIVSGQSGSFGNAESINRGQVVMLQSDASGNVIASMAVMVNLSGTGQNQYMAGSPCQGVHMLAINKGAGLDDNCVTVDSGSVKSPSGDFGYLDFSVTQTRSAGRSYLMHIRFDVAALGFPGTLPADWRPDTMGNTPEKAEFIERLRVWAESLRAATSRAVEFAKPADSFANVPSYRTLVSVK